MILVGAISFRSYFLFFGLGRIDEVLVDVRRSGRREVSYSNPGDKAHFKYRKPDVGSTLKCHVQATTKKVSIKMHLDGREIPG